MGVYVGCRGRTLCVYIYIYIHIYIYMYNGYIHTHICFPKGLVEKATPSFECSRLGCCRAQALIQWFQLCSAMRNQEADGRWLCMCFLSCILVGLQLALSATILRSVSVRKTAVGKWHWSCWPACRLQQCLGS